MSQKKVLFRLVKDDEGYPPVDVESVWAEEASDGKYIIDNIPFFTSQATLGDVVEVAAQDEELFYISTHQRSGNSLLRVIFFDDCDPSNLRADLAKLGCSSELSHPHSMISLSVPLAVNIEDVRNLLEIGCDLDRWEYEEAILRQ